MAIRNRSCWSDLPAELLEIIADRHRNNTDVSRIRSVCQSWRSSIPPFQYPIPFPLYIPYISPQFHTQSFLLLSHSTLYHLSQPSTSKGWLVKLRETTQSTVQRQRQTHVPINPLSPLQIQPLPDHFPKVIDLSKFRVSELARAHTLQFPNGTFFDYRVAVCVNHDRPSSIMIVASGVLWELKLQCQDRWKTINDMSSQLFFEDVVLHRGKFCAVDCDGRAVEVDSSSSSVREIAQPLRKDDWKKKRLVVSGEDLLLVDEIRRRGGLVEGFRVFKLDLDNKRWVKLRRLDDLILFLGDDCSFSVPASSLGEGLKGNSIVFKDQSFKVFGLEDRKLSLMDSTPEYVKIFYPPSST